MPRPDRPPRRWLSLDRVASAGALLGTMALAFRFGQVAPQAGEQASDRSGRGSPSTPPSAPARRSGHETEDMSGGLMARLGIMLGTVALVAVFAMVGLRIWVRNSYVGGQPQFTALQTAPEKPPAPGLQANPLQEWHDVRARAEQLLDNYGWADDARTRARIPIGRAMALTAGHGLEPPP